MINEILEKIKNMNVVRKHATKISIWENTNNKSIDIELDTNNKAYFNKTIEYISKIEGVKYCMFSRNDYCSSLRIAIK